LNISTASGKCPLTIKEEKKVTIDFLFTSDSKDFEFFFFFRRIKTKQNRHVLSNGTLHFPAYRSDAYRSGRRI
jgi:hypothetical protein